MKMNLNFISCLVLVCFFKGHLFKESKKMLQNLKCMENIVKSHQVDEKILSSKETRSPSYIATFCIGRLGNQMSAFATLYALEKLHGCKIFFAQYQKDYLLDYFRSDYLKNLEGQTGSYLRYKWIRPFKNYDFSNQTVWELHKFGKYLELGLFPNSINLFKHFSKELRKIFSPFPEHKTIAEERLHSIKKQHLTASSLDPNQTLTFVGIHVRRSDYEEYLSVWHGKKFVDEEYFPRAIKFYREQFQNIIFLVISDDPEWCFQNILPLGKDIYFAGHSTKEKDEIHPESVGIDMLTLSLTNHTILTYGTYGQWGAFFSGGQAVWPKSHEDTNELKEVTKAEIPGWTFI